MRKILFITEGKKGEPQLINLINKFFLKHDDCTYDIAVYDADIYELYRELKEDEYLDIIELIKKRVKKDDKLYNRLKESRFSEIYLIFDLEPQDDKFSFAKVEELINYFNNETTRGKIYINYPMVESFKHFEHLPDEKFNSYTIPRMDCYNDNYKKHIKNISCINNLSKVTRDNYIIILKQMLDKYEYILKCNITSSKKHFKENFSQEKLLLAVEQFFKEKEEIIVFNTICIWPIEYYNERFFKKILN